MGIKVSTHGLMMKKMFISQETAKYTRRYDLKDSKWVNPFLCTDWNVAKEEWVVETLKNCYEDYIRKNPTLMEALSELNSKNLGCWCTKTELCHGEVLVKLYIEKFGEGKDYMKQTKDSGEKEKKGLKHRDYFTKKHKKYHNETDEEEEDKEVEKKRLKHGGYFTKKHKKHYDSTDGEDEVDEAEKMRKKKR